MLCPITGGLFPSQTLQFLCLYRLSLISFSLSLSSKCVLCWLWTLLLPHLTILFWFIFFLFFLRHGYSLMSFLLKFNILKRKTIFPKRCYVVTSIDIINWLINLIFVYSETKKPQSCYWRYCIFLLFDHQS